MFTLNSTETTVPSTSDAVAEIGTTVFIFLFWLLVGSVITTEGGVLGLTLIETAAEASPTRPLLSVALAVILCNPFTVLEKLAVKGAVLSMPTDAPSTKNSTEATEPSTSTAVAAITIGSPFTNIAPANGAEILAVGF